MASVIKIKRSSSTASPVSLASGELAYSWEQSTGGKLYIGWGTESIPGEADNIDPIGGVFFTSKLSHAPGTLTANSAIIVDGDSKIDRLNVDNLRLDGNTLSSTNLNGNIILDPNGTGNINVSGAVITNLGAPSADTDAATVKFVNDSIDSLNLSSNFSFAGDVGAGNIILASEVFTISGGIGISTVGNAAGNSLTINLDDTSVTAGTYGSATQIPIVSVNSRGQITSVSLASISTNLSISGDSGTDSVNLLNDILDFEGGVGISTTVSNNKVAISGTDASTIVKGIARFDSTNFSVSSGVVTTNDFTIGTTSLTLGETVSSLAGLAQVDVGDLRIVDNSISATDTNGNITLSPSGSGFVSVNDSLIKNVANPVEPTDAANKRYVDEMAQGLKALPAATAATISDLGGTYNNVSGTITISNTPTLTIDGISSWNIGDNVLVKDQNNARENGSYEFTQLGSAGNSNTWVLTRCEFCNEESEIYGSFEFVSSGTINSSTGWVITTPSDFIFGSTDLSSDPRFTTKGDIEWIQFSGAGTYVAGNALSLTGNEFSVNVDNSSIEISSNDIKVKNLGITNAMLAGGIANSKLSNSTITFAAESGTADPVALGETVTFTAGEGINTVVSNNQIAISGEDASYTNKGISRYNSTDFIVSSGVVQLNDEAIQDIIGNFVIASQGISATYNDAANVLQLSGILATTANVGVASFNPDNFSVTAGAVAIETVDGGTY